MYICIHILVHLYVDVGYIGRNRLPRIQTTWEPVAVPSSILGAVFKELS